MLFFVTENEAGEGLLVRDVQTFLNYERIKEEKEVHQRQLRIEREQKSLAELADRQQKKEEEDEQKRREEEEEFRQRKQKQKEVKKKTRNPYTDLPTETSSFTSSTKRGVSIYNSDPNPYAEEEGEEVISSWEDPAFTEETDTKRSWRRSTDDKEEDRDHVYIYECTQGKWKKILQKGMIFNNIKTPNGDQGDLYFRNQIKHPSQFPGKVQVYMDVDKLRVLGIDVYVKEEHERFKYPNHYTMGLMNAKRQCSIPLQMPYSGENTYTKVIYGKGRQ